MGNPMAWERAKIKLRIKRKVELLMNLCCSGQRLVAGSCEQGDKPSGLTKCWLIS
jgi:hypothetical protein